MELACLPAAVVLFSTLSYCWSLIRHSLCGQDDPCPKTAIQTTPTSSTDKVYQEPKARQFSHEYDGRKSEKQSATLPTQHAALSDREGPDIPISSPQLIGATPDESGIDVDSGCGSHIMDLVSRTDDIWQDARAQQVLRREAAQFWTHSPDTQTWYHHDDTTGEKIWAPVDLD